jgi:hypothetical protein
MHERSPPFSALSWSREMKPFLIALLAFSIAGCAATPVGSGEKAGGDTALVCHTGKKTMELPQEAVQAHLNHGDRLGPC